MSLALGRVLAQRSSTVILRQSMSLCLLFVVQLTTRSVAAVPPIVASLAHVRVLIAALILALIYLLLLFGHSPSCCAFVYALRDASIG